MLQDFENFCGIISSLHVLKDSKQQHKPQILYSFKKSKRKKSLSNQSSMTSVVNPVAIIVPLGCVPCSYTKLKFLQCKNGICALTLIRTNGSRTTCFAPKFTKLSCIMENTKHYISKCFTMLACRLVQCECSASDHLAPCEAHARQALKSNLSIKNERKLI